MSSRRLSFDSLRLPSQPVQRLPLPHGEGGVISGKGCIDVAEGEVYASSLGCKPGGVGIDQLHGLPPRNPVASNLGEDKVKQGLQQAGDGNGISCQLATALRRILAFSRPSVGGGQHRLAIPLVMLVGGLLATGQQARAQVSLSHNGTLLSNSVFVTPPGIPPRLYLEERSGLIKVWWGKPAGATIVRLQRSQTNGNWDSAVSVEANAEGGVAQSSGLQNGTTYYFRLSFKSANSDWGPGSILKGIPGTATFSASVVTPTSATLKLSKYDGWGNLRPENVVDFDSSGDSIRNNGHAATDWSYRRTSPTQSGCTSVPKTTGTEVTVSGLTTDPYTFTAYRDTTCTTELATATVNKRELTVSEALAANSRTLTITNQTGNWYYKYTSPGGGQCSSAGSGTTATATGLTANTTYTFTAYSDSYCNTELATAASFTTPPGIPPRLYLEERSGLIKVWWGKPAGATIVRLQRSQTNGNWDSAVSVEANAEGGVAQSSGLQNGTTYYFRLSFKSANSDWGPGSILKGIPGTATFSASVVTPTSATLKLSKYDGWGNLRPENVVDFDSSGDSIRNNGHAATDWSYRRTSPTQSGCMRVPKTTGTEVTVSGLTTDPYTFTAYSDTTCTTELATATVNKRELTVSEALAANSRTLTITNQTGNWYYKYTSPGGGQCSSAGSGTTATATGLTANTTYTFTAYSDSYCNTELATAASFTTPPGIPPRLYLKEESGLIKFWWGKPAGATIVRLQRSQTNGNWDSSVSVETNAEGGVAQSSGLQNGTTYYFRLSFKSANSGWGPGSILKATPGPVAFNATTTSQNRATLRLSKYDDWGNLRPENVVRFDNKEYREESIKNQGSARTDWSYKQTSPPEDTCTDVPKADGAEATVTGLSSGTSYIYKAYSGSGCTDANALGDEASFRTRTPAPPTPPPASPEISASAVTATTATLTIANYSGSWYYKRTAPTEGDHPYGSCSAVVDRTSVELTGLSASTSYSFTAYSDGGCTTELATATVSTPAPAVTLTATDATANSLKLTIANHSGSWHYKYTIPSGGQCSGVVSGSTAVASGLQSSTSYTFKAYSDSGCSTVLATATATSTLAPEIALTAGDATATSLKLTIVNYSGNWYYKYTSSSSGQCSGAVSGSIAVASNLQSSTSYTFKAYNDSGCNTVLATAAATSTLAPGVALTAGDATATSLKLTIVNHSGNWYYKYTTPSSGQCSGAVSGSIAVASGLQSSTSYIFKAYSDSGCSTVLATAAATSTLAPGVALTAGDATATSLKLTIVNHSGNWYYKYTTPNGGQCSGAVSGRIAVASGLQSSTSYILKAYSDSSCSTVLATAAATSTLAPEVALTAGDATATSLKLTIANHSGSWYYKHTTPSGGQCSSMVSGTTAVASGLQSSTSYIFKAYSDSGCNTVLATAAATSTNKDPATQAVQKRANQVAQVVTPEVNRVVSANTANAVNQRVSQVVQGTLPLAGTQISWGNLPNTAEGAMELARRWAVDGETISAAALLDNSSFTTSFPSQSQAAATEMGDGSAPSFPWRVWGAVDYGQIASGEDQGTTEWDAAVLTALVGADRMMNDRLLAGAALAWSSSSFDYQTNGSSDDLVEGKGEGSLQLFTITPYLGWRLDGGQSLWASVGYGWGDLTIDDDAGQDTSTDLTQWSLAAGASGVFYQSSQSSSATEPEAAATNQLLWKADAWLSSLQVAGNDLLQDDLQAYRLRLGVEGNRAIPLDNAALLTPSLGLFYRYDGGDGSMTGSGLDLAAALRYDTPNGLRLEGRGRTLLLHSEELKDWGISGLVRYSPRGDDGFSISLSPKWGRTATNDLQQLWSNHQDQFSTTGDMASALLLAAELRSPKLAMGSYMLTPALGFQFSPDAWTTRLGTTLHFHSSLNLQLDLSQQQPEEGDTNHSLGLNLQMEF